MPHVSGHNPHYDGGTGTSVGAVGGYMPPKPPKEDKKDPPDTSSTNVYSQAAGSGYQGAGYIHPKERTEQVVQSAVNELNNIVSNIDDKNKPGNVVINPKFIKEGGVFEPDNMPDSYADMNEAQKAIYNFYASSTPNLYQQNIQDFISASPLNMEIYKNSGLKGAGLNAFMTTVPENILGSTMFGQLAKSIAGGAGKIKDTLSGLLSTEQGQEAGSNIQSAYQNYLDTINKQIVAERDKKPNIAEVSGDSTPLGDIYGVDYIYDKDYMLPGAMEEAILAGEEPYDPAIAEDKEAQEEIERSLLNQYSLLNQDNLASSLVDETQESELEGIIDPKVGEDADMDAMPYGYPGLNLPRTGTYPDNPLAGMEGYPVIQTGVQYDAPLGQGGEFNFNEYAPSTFNNPNYAPLGGPIYSENISTMPKLGDEIKSADFSNLNYKDGGSVYNVLKLINDTMHDG